MTDPTAAPTSAEPQPTAWWTTQLATLTHPPAPTRNENQTHRHAAHRYASDIVTAWQTVRCAEWNDPTFDPTEHTAWTSPNRIVHQVGGWRPGYKNTNTPSMFRPADELCAIADSLYLLDPWTPATAAAAHHLYRHYVDAPGDQKITLLVRATLTDLDDRCPEATNSGFTAAYLAARDARPARNEIDPEALIDDIAAHWNP